MKHKDIDLLDYNQDGNWVYLFKIPIAIVMRVDLSLIILWIVEGMHAALLLLFFSC